ncbi:MAG: hypothetical protein IE933_12290 [Sphingomonadales bacterium]|nr:hypothetical protein [Sphingomonadales bacterium]MBD3773009.1 hypothetical protein [Paracoccaceae bacterium]
MMGFWSGIRLAYRESWAFMLACPLLFLVPVLGEVIQHIVEMQIGMYDSLAAAQAADADPLRMAFGFVKTIGLMLPGYWVIRFIAGGRDAAAARRFEPRAAALFTYYLIFQAALSAVQLFALPRSGTALIVAMVAGLFLNPLLARWAASAPLGLPTGPIASARVMAIQVPWAIGFSLAVILPLMVPHYILGAAALFAPAVLKWPVLIVDSLLVGYLAAVMVAATWVIATRKTPLAAPGAMPDSA